MLPRPNIGRFAQTGAVYLALMACLTVTGLRSDLRMRLLLVGRLYAPQWVTDCECWFAGLRSVGAPDVTLELGSPRAAPLEGWRILLGRADPRDHGLVFVEHDRPIPTIEPTTRAFVEWLRSSRPVSLMLLFVLLLYRWRAIAALQAILMSVAFAAGATLALDHAALGLGVGLPDLSWVLTVTAAACAGWQAARYLDQVLQNRVRGMAAGIVTAILFGNIGGPLDTLLGLAVPVLVPILSQRVAMAFIIALCFSASMQLPSSADPVAATVALGVAGIDRWRRGSSAANAPSRSR